MVHLISSFTLQPCTATETQTDDLLCCYANHDADSCNAMKWNLLTIKQIKQISIQNIKLLQLIIHVYVHKHVFMHMFGQFEHVYINPWCPKELMCLLGVHRGSRRAGSESRRHCDYGGTSGQWVVQRHLQGIFWLLSSQLCQSTGKFQSRNAPTGFNKAYNFFNLWKWY